MGVRSTVRACVLTDAGKIRTDNEDSFYFDGTVSRLNVKSQCLKDKKSDPAQIYAVFDGVGGEAYGEIASNTAANTLADCVKRFEKTGGTVFNLVNTFISQANDALVARSSELQVPVIASTCVIACVFGSKLFVLNVGDSKAFYASDGEMKLITKEHLSTDGEGKGALIRCLGLPAEQNRMTPYYAKVIEPKDGDMLLMCSDGLTDMLDTQTISDCLDSGQPVDEICRRLCTLALEAGGKDNITMLLLKF